MLKVICFKWQQFGYRSAFDGEHVNVLRNMVRRNYPHPHEFICITDNRSNIDKSIRCIDIWDDYSLLCSPHGENYPSCYRRLKMFSNEFGKIIGGNRFVCLDLDTVIVGDMSPIWNREEDFIIWGDTHPKTLYNGSMQMMTVGSRSHVWEKFHPVESPIQTRKAKIMGSDQAWISYVLGPGEAKWTQEDGVYSYRMHLRPEGGKLPKNAKIVFFHGNVDPWEYEVRGKLDWVMAHWR